MPTLCGLRAGSSSHLQQLLRSGITDPGYSVIRHSAIVVGLGEADLSAGFALDLAHLSSSLTPPYGGRWSSEKR